MSTPRFELSPTTRFADRASDYALFRPSYPKAAIDAAIRAASERELSEGMRASIDEALLVAGRTVAPRPFPYTQSLSRDGLVGRARSASYVPKDGPRYDQLLRDLDDLWTAHHDARGLVTLGYRTFVWCVERGQNGRR